MYAFKTASRLSAFAVLTFSTLTFAQNTQHYKQTNLVSDQAGVAAVTDPNLINPWGLSRSSGGPWWISDNGTGLSTLYAGTGSVVPLVVTVPGAASGQPGSPTGTVFNGGQGFALKPGLPALFLFVTEDGTISGWNPKVDPKNAVIVVNRGASSVFKGATIATIRHADAGESLLYVADFRAARVRVYNSQFQPVPELEERFGDDDDRESGYAPFNVQNIGGNLYVAYALQDTQKHDEVAGTGLGFVEIYSPEGHRIGRLERGPWFNAPWGLAQASGDFGSKSHDILVGQFGSGEIVAFNPVTGRYDGRLRDATNAPIRIDGLWALALGNDASAGAATSVYFSAGPGNEQHGLLGTITAIENAQGNDR